jgi:hypothetical protein
VSYNACFQAVTSIYLFYSGFCQFQDARIVGIEFAWFVLIAHTFTHY